MRVGEEISTTREAPLQRRHQEERSRSGPELAAHRRLKVVAIGGGTGLPTLLEGLARLGRRQPALGSFELTAVVAMSDDGGSSGRLRRENGMLPPGDLRNCLVALADPEGGAFPGLFRYRFGKGEGLRGHSLGNLLITALTSIEGDFVAGLERAERMLGCCGRVIPSTLERVELVGRMADGSMIRGEHAINEHRGARIERLELTPRAPKATPGVLDAIARADVVVIGPGSLYSSVIANLLVDEVAEALAASSALRILIQNLMTEPGETQGMDAVDHLEAIIAHVGEVVDVLLFDGLEGSGLRPEVLSGYAAMGQRQVRVDPRAILERDVIPVEASLLAAGTRMRHDPDKVAAAVLGLALQGVEV